MAGTVAQQLDDVELDEQEHEYENLTVHHLSRENDLNEETWTASPTYEYAKEESVHLHHEVEEVIENREHRLEVIKEEHRLETATVITATASAEQEEPVPDRPPPHPPTSTLQPQPQIAASTLHYEPPPVRQPNSVSGSKKNKHVTISFPSFGRRSQPGEVAHDTNGESQRHGLDRDAPITIACYPGRLLRPLDILRVVQIILGIIICSAANAEQCFSLGLTICVYASSITWSDQLGGIGYVLFVGIVFILGNFAWLFYHLLNKPSRPHSAATDASRFSAENRVRLAELIYNGVAVIFYIIAACVAAWYASWTDFPNGYHSNPYRPQWIAAAIFAWINSGLYIITVLYSLFIA